MFSVDAYTVYMCTITTTGCSTGYYGYNTGLNSLFGLGGYQTYYLYPSTSLYGFGGFGGYYGGFGGYYPYNYYVPTIPQVTNVPTIGSVPNINTVPNIGGTTATGPCKYLQKDFLMVSVFLTKSDCIF